MSKLKAFIMEYKNEAPQLKKWVWYMHKAKSGRGICIMQLYKCYVLGLTANKGGPIVQ